MDIQNFKAEFKKTFIYDMLCETLEDEQLFEHTIVGNQVIWMKEQTRQMWSIWQAAKASAVLKWISVQDKLPKFQQEVLILVGDEYLVAEYLPSETNAFGIQFNEGFWINGGASLVDADLWMPLPKPPKAQEPSHDS